jgi:hypothetical protein
MEKNKAPAPDGFSAELYQTFWEVIKFDLMKLFGKFQQRELPLFHLNYGTTFCFLKKRMPFKHNNTGLFPC